MHDNKQLQQLQEKVSQKKRLEAKWRELQSQQEDLSRHVQELKTVMGNEQADVDRLERTSLTAVFYAVIGKKEDMLDKEKAEAYAAKVKYDSAVQELNLVANDTIRSKYSFVNSPNVSSSTKRNYKKKTGPSRHPALSMQNISFSWKNNSPHKKYKRWKSEKPSLPVPGPSVLLTIFFPA